MASSRDMMKPNDLKVASITPFGLRLQPDLKRRVEEAARASGNSLNAEIAARLEASLGADAARSSVDDQVSMMRAEIDDLREEVKALRHMMNVVMEIEIQPKRQLAGDDVA